MKKIVGVLDKVEKGSTNNISAEGATELMGIASRLYKNNSNIFAGRPKITVAITKEARTRQSADTFLKGLKPLLLYRNKAGKYLLRCLLNEKDPNIPVLKPAYTNFYEWKDVKAPYIKRLKAIGANPKGNMLSYLKEVK